MAKLSADEVMFLGQSDEEADWLQNLPLGKQTRELLWPEKVSEFDPGQARDESGRFTISSVALSHHAFERIGDRHKFASVKRTLLALKDKPVPDGDWYAPMKKGDKVDGYIVGTDGVIKTVLGEWYNRSKLRGEPLAEFDPGQARDEGGRWTSGGSGSISRTASLKTIYADSISQHAQMKQIKGEIIASLANQTGVSVDAVEYSFAAWLDSSNDSQRTSLRLQEAASEEFGVGLSPYQADCIGKPYGRSAQLTRDQARVLVRGIYAQTQAELDSRGFGPDDTITVYRGTSLGGRKQEIKEMARGNALESYSLNLVTAESFGHAFRTEIPRKDVFALASRGFGSLPSEEIICFGREREITWL